MEFFKSGLKSVLGSQEPTEEPSGAETVDRLIERVKTSTLLDDRRDACRALRALSKKYRIEVGAHGMDALVTVLQTDHGDCEIVGYALDTLCNITSPQAFEEEERPELSAESLNHVGEQFTEMFIKCADNVSMVLGFLEEYDFKVRWSALKLLSSLLNNRLRDIQEIILVSPMGVSKLMDLLGDTREVIRNDALLLLALLTKGNANIQKIVAFENAFDRLFDVITEEGYSDGGIVVEDCLLLMLNLLRNNTSNQNFFKEGSYIQRLVPMFETPPDKADLQWSPQKVSNIDCVLQVVRTLVSPGNAGQVTSGCQKVVRSTGILVHLCNMLMASGVPVDVLTEAICAVAEVIRGSHHNQEFFATFMAPSNPPREALIVLLMSMVNEKQPFTLRCAVMYCFHCYLYKNEVGQAQIVQTLLPSAIQVGVVTCGQLLCSGLFSHDPLSNWFASVALSHCLIENPQQKEQLLRVLLAPAPASQPISLIHELTTLLQQSSKLQSKVGSLILLSTWLAHCPQAVTAFLTLPSSMPYLISQAGSTDCEENEELLQGLCAFLMGLCILFNDDSVPAYTREGLKQLVVKRMGTEMFISKMSEVSRHEQYSRAVKQPQPISSATPTTLLLDYEFCKLFRALEGMVQKGVVDGEEGDGSGAEYKEQVREMERRAGEAVAAKQLVEARLRQTEQLVTRLSDENTLLRAQITAGAGVVSPDVATLHMEISRLRSETLEKDLRIRKLEEDLERLSLAVANTPPPESQTNLGANQGEMKEKVAQLESDKDDLLELLADQETKLATYKQRLRALGEMVEEDSDDVEADDASPPS